MELDMMAQSIISVAIGIIFIAAAIIYIRRKNKGTTRQSRVLDTFDQYDANMEQYRKGSKKK